MCHCRSIWMKPVYIIGMFLFITTGPPSSIVFAEGPAATSALELDAMMVTAQKKEENVQEVPISITVFDSVSLEDRKIESVRDITAYTPNMAYFAAGGEGVGTPTVRGITASLRTFGTSTALYVDGIPYTRGFGFDSILHDIERVEVLKGPQGTLYGKNAEAGVVNITTRKPGNVMRATAGAELGEDNRRVFNAGVSGPIVRDKLFAGVSVKHHEKDGFIKNVYRGGTVNDQEYNYGKVNLRYAPNEDLDISFLISQIQYDNGDLTLNNISAPNPREVSSDLEGYDKPSSLISGFKAKYRRNAFLFETVLTYWNYQFDSLNDFDFTADPMGQYHLRSKNEFNKLSGEFRVSSRMGKVDWLVGFYADKDDDEVKNTMMMAGGFDMDITHDLKNDAIGVFAHTRYALTDRLSLSGGLRYDRDNKSFEEASSGMDVDDDYSELSPKVAIQYAVTEDAMVFATASKGYRAGGFNSFAPTYDQSDFLSYDEETIWNYEMGAKTALFHRRVLLNASVYYMDISDMQVETAVNNIFTHVLNAASATSKGVEVEMRIRATDTCDLFGSFGYNDVAFEDFSDAMGNYDGNTNPFAPEYNFNIGAQYRSKTGWFARLDLNGYGKMYLDKANLYERDAYCLVNTKMGYERERFDAYLYARNLFDEEYDAVGYYDGRYTVPSPPAEVGVRVNYRF